MVHDRPRLPPRNGGRGTLKKMKRLVKRVPGTVRTWRSIRNTVANRYHIYGQDHTLVSIFRKDVQGSPKKLPRELQASGGWGS